MILAMKRFWHKEMLEGLKNYLTAIQDHFVLLFCSAKVSIYSVHRKLVVSSCYAQNLSNSIYRSIHVVQLYGTSHYSCNQTSSNDSILKRWHSVNWAIDHLDPVDRRRLTESRSFVSSVFKTFNPSAFIKCCFF